MVFITNKRLEFHDILKSILGSNKVYFQPPSTVKMNQPYIIYSLTGFNILHANNEIYKNKVGYTVLLITASPEDPVILKLLKTPFCKFDRAYTANNLNHYVYNIYY